MFSVEVFENHRCIWIETVDGLEKGPIIEVALPRRNFAQVDGQRLAEEDVLRVAAANMWPELINSAATRLRLSASLAFANGVLNPVLDRGTSPLWTPRSPVSPEQAPGHKL